MIREKIEASLNRFTSESLVDAKFIVMDSESYFELKIEEFGDVNKAIENEVETYLGLRVFHNNLEYTYVDIA